MAKIKADYYGKGIGDGSNCFPRAVANACGISYEDAMMLCIEHGYDNGMPLDKLVKMSAVLKCMHLAVCEWKDGEAITEYAEAVADKIGSPRFSRCTVKKLLQVVVPTEGRWIVVTRKHAFAVVGGKIYDNGTTSERDRVALVINCAEIITEEGGAFEDGFEDDIECHVDY